MVCCYIRFSHMDVRFQSFAMLIQKILTLIVILLSVLVSVTWLVSFKGFCYETTAPRSDNVPVHLTIPVKQQHHDVLLVGYLRGGTTFTGKILGHRPGTFYVYEPFHSLSTWGYFTQGLHCSIKDEHCEKANGTDQSVLEVLRGIYHCDKNHLLNSLLIWQVLKGRGFDDSIQNPMWMKYVPECHGEVNGCVEKFVNQCSNSTVRVSKVPRISVRLAAQLLNSEPNLKIIHLLRDPRAIMNSRSALKWTPAPGGSSSLCKKMTEDFLDSDFIRKFYPDRILTVFYEDLVTKPVETVQKMYEFTGYDFDENEYIRLNRLTGMTKDSAQSLSNKKTSLEIAMAWRTKIAPELVDVINQGCNNLYDLVGYPPLKSSGDLLNNSKPLRQPNR